MKQRKDVHLLRVACIIWSTVWFLAWLGSTVFLFVARDSAQSHAFQWFRTGSLLAGWAGVFAWKALEEPRR